MHDDDSDIDPDFDSGYAEGLSDHADGMPRQAVDHSSEWGGKWSEGYNAGYYETGD